MTVQHLIDKFWRPDIALLVGAMTLSAAIFGINAITLDNLREDTFRSAQANVSSRAIVLAKESDRSFKVLDLAMSSLSEHMASFGVSKTKHYK